MKNREENIASCSIATFSQSLKIKHTLLLFLERYCSTLKCDLTFNNRQAAHQTRAQQWHKVKQSKHFYSSMLLTTGTIILHDDLKPLSFNGKACGESSHTALQTHCSRAVVLGSDSELVNSLNGLSTPFAETPRPPGPRNSSSSD